MLALGKVQLGQYQAYLDCKGTSFIGSWGEAWDKETVGRLSEERKLEFVSQSWENLSTEYIRPLGLSGSPGTLTKLGKG
jgi:hypothetical protein